MQQRKRQVQPRQRRAIGCPGAQIGRVLGRQLQRHDYRRAAAGRGRGLGDQANGLLWGACVKDFLASFGGAIHLRNEGAAMYALTRNLGNAIGISVLQRQMIHYTAQSQSTMVEGVRPDNPVIGYARPDLDFASVEAMSRMAREIARQASMVGYVGVYQLCCVLTLAALPLVLLMRRSRPRAGPEPLPVME